MRSWAGYWPEQTAGIDDLACGETDMSTSDEWRTIHNPLTGEVLTFLETGIDRMVGELTLPPGGEPVPPHAHPGSESFEVLAGVLHLQVDRHSMDLEPGESWTVTDEVHSISNTSSRPVVVRLESTLGRRAERGLRAYFGMARDGIIRSDGPPRDILAAALELHRSGLYMPPLPRWAFKALVASVGTIGRWAGKEETVLSRYWPDETEPI